MDGRTSLNTFKRQGILKVFYLEKTTGSTNSLMEYSQPIHFLQLLLALGFGLKLIGKKLKTKTDTNRKSVFGAFQSELILTSIFDQICFNCPQNLVPLKNPSYLYFDLQYMTGVVWWSPSLEYKGLLLRSWDSCSCREFLFHVSCSPAVFLCSVGELYTDPEVSSKPTCATTKHRFYPSHGTGWWINRDPYYSWKKETPCNWVGFHPLDLDSNQISRRKHATWERSYLKKETY